VRTLELFKILNGTVLHFEGGFIIDNFSRTLRTRIDFRPYCVVDLALGLAIGVERLIHPPALVFHLFQDALCFPLKGRYIHRRVVVVGDECGCRG